ncbi:MAG: hypothetical protein ACYC7D_15225 [Nitrososphaerales archaeon]
MRKRKKRKKHVQPMMLKLKRNLLPFWKLMERKPTAQITRRIYDVRVAMTFDQNTKGKHILGLVVNKGGWGDVAAAAFSQKESQKIASWSLTLKKASKTT